MKTSMTRMKSPTHLVTLALTSSLLGLGATACGVQHDDAYPGEALATINGRVTNELPTPPAAEVTLLWFYDSTAGDGWAAETAEVEGEFPAAFTLDLYTPPVLPEGTMFAIAYVLAVDPVTFTPDDGEPGDNLDWMLGASERHVILYLGQDTAAFAPDERARIEEHLGGALDAGFHILAAEPDDDDDDTWVQLSPAPEDTSITVRMAPYADLVFPEFS